MTAQPEVPESGRKYSQALSNCSRAARVQCAAAGGGGGGGGPRRRGGGGGGGGGRRPRSRAEGLGALGSQKCTLGWR